MQATFKFTDLLALGAIVLSCGGLVWQVQDHGGRLTKLEDKAGVVETRLATIDTNLAFLVDREKRREGRADHP